jgi:hypothetical protein
VDVSLIAPSITLYDARKLCTHRQYRKSGRDGFVAGGELTRFFSANAESGGNVNWSSRPLRTS